MNVTGSPLQNAALALLGRAQPSARPLTLGDLIDLAAKPAARPAPLPKPEPVEASAAPTRPLRPGSFVDIKV